jgi:hypothetical protein
MDGSGNQHRKRLIAGLVDPLERGAAHENDRRLYATSTNRRSMTFVSVGPVTSKSPTAFSKG